MQNLDTASFPLDQHASACCISTRLVTTGVVPPSRHTMSAKHTCLIGILAAHLMVKSECRRAKVHFDYSMLPATASLTSKQCNVLPKADPDTCQSTSSMNRSMAMCLCLTVLIAHIASQHASLSFAHAILGHAGIMQMLAQQSCNPDACTGSAYPQKLTMGIRLMLWRLNVLPSLCPFRLHCTMQ